MSRAREEVREERERQRQHEAEERTRSKALDDAFNRRGELSRDWMEEILETEDLEEKLQPNTISKVQAMLNKQWILANLSEAQAHDRTYWLEVKKLEILAQHPPEGSAITGEVRAQLFGDEEEKLEPLTPQERQAIDQVVKTLQNTVTRSTGGFERKQLNTSIARSETETSKSTDDGGWGLDGLFG